MRLYFLACFALLLAPPCLIILVTAARPLEALASFGWTFGRAGLGAALTLCGLPLAILAGFIGSRDPALQKMYPFAKTACADRRAFAGYELSTSSSITCRGNPSSGVSSSCPSSPAIGLIPALAVQTVISTLLHIGHPDSGDLRGRRGRIGLRPDRVFTGSFVYPLILHASAGVSTDTFLFLRSRKAGR